jgi:hypothetical protein
LGNHIVNRFLGSRNDAARVDVSFDASQALPVVWPAGKQFAFTIVDDTDAATVENTRPIYDFLAEHGLRTTKTVWPLAPAGCSVTGGDSLEKPAYRDWILELKARGFEIGLHGVSDGSSVRSRVVQGLDRFQEMLGADPEIYVNHTGQAESIYWGTQRVDPPIRWIYDAYCKSKGYPAFQGADRLSPHFWGDVCWQRTKYVRNLVFTDINTLNMDPLMPYHDPRRPFVRYWFSSSYGSNVDDFCELLSERNQDRLIGEGGACIVYTHFSAGFCPMTPLLKRLIRRIAGMPGWFPPASTLLDFLGDRRGWRDAADQKMLFQRMQWRWFRDQALRISQKRSGHLVHR